MDEKWMDEWMKEWMDKGVDRWMNRWIDCGWIRRQIEQPVLDHYLS